jgi:hypothetical protein
MAGIEIRVQLEGFDRMRAFVAGMEGKLQKAAAKAANDTAKAAAEELNASTRSAFDRPNKFTQRAAFVSQYATASNPSAEVALRPLQAQYLRPQIVGGQRPAKHSERRLAASSPSLNGRAAWRPGIDAGRDASGNIRRRQLVDALSGRDPRSFLLAEQRGKLRPGVYRRMARGQLRNVLAFGQLPTLARRWDVEKIGRNAVSRAWPAAIRRRLDEALKG